MYRHVIIEQGSYVYHKDNQLYVRGDGSEHKIPIEDIATVLLASPQITITSRALDALVTAGTDVIVCDNKYSPCGALLALHILEVHEHGDKGKYAKHDNEKNVDPPTCNTPLGKSLRG